VLTIADVLNGPRVYATLAARTSHVIGRRFRAAEIDSPLKIRTFVQIGGSLREPDFRGIRVRSYLRAQGVANIEIAVTSDEADDPKIPGLMVDRIIEGIEILATRSRRSGVEVDLEPFVAFITSQRASIVRAAPRSKPLRVWRRDASGRRVDIDQAREAAFVEAWEARRTAEADATAADEDQPANSTGG
jgi:hypothetical protein